MKIFAGLGARCIAFFIDAFFLCVVWGAVALYAAPDGFPLPGWSFVVLAAVFFTALTASPWQGSLGKKALSIKVTDLAGHRIGPGRAFVRFVMTCVTLATAGVGFLLAAWTPRRQALHDLVARTLVADAKAVPEQISGGIPDRISWTNRIVSVIAMALLVVAADNVIDMYHAVLVRDATQELYGGMAEFKAEVTSALNEHRAIPPTASKLPPHARALTTRPDGTIVLETTDDLFPNGRYFFMPTIGPTGVTEWSCTTENIETKYLPATCR